MSTQLCGVLYAFAAFIAWGLLPLYWKQLQEVAPIEIFCHRVVWSCLFLCLIINYQKRWPEVVQAFKCIALLKKLCWSSLMVATNWLVYIWAVNTGHVVETSLGYYTTPMVSILLGFLLLGERFSRPQLFALASVVLGIGYSLLSYGALPVFGLTLAVSFAFYGYIRKQLKILPIPALLVETCVLVIPALIYLGWRVLFAESLFLQRVDITLWLLGSGIATSLPLLWFAGATARLKLSTVGIIQYLAPTIAFFLGIFLYHEAFGRHTLITFCLIWLGVFIYAFESFRKATAVDRRE